MQDNAPIHTAKKVKKWFEDTSIVITDWPPYSPDLNPIEHLWYKLKQVVNEIRPDINTAGGGEEEVKRKLFEALEEAWSVIDIELMKGLIKSMERRIKACIDAEG